MNRLTGAIKTGFTNLLDSHLPGRTKRLIFLASFCARLKGESALDHETISKLNQAMVLSSSDSALSLPVELSKVIWNGRTISEITHDEVQAPQELTKDRLQTVAEYVLNAMPSWLRYGADDVIRKDVVKLLGNRELVGGH